MYINNEITPAERPQRDSNAHCNTWQHTATLYHTLQHTYTYIYTYIHIEITPAETT